MLRWLLLIPSVVPLLLLGYGYYDALFGPLFPPNAADAFASVEVIQRGPETSWDVLTFLCVNFSLAAGYAVHAYRSASMAPQQRPIWLVLLLSAGPVALPVYWAHYLLNAPIRRPGTDAHARLVADRES